MAIEVYLEDEVKELVENSEQTEEWKQQIAALGMTGQTEMIAGEKSPIPFPCMNKAMTNVYTTLCPSRVDFKQYNRGTIPLRVLSAISLCIQQNYFHKIEIWYDDVQPDPIAVGTLNPGWNSPTFIIARWGDELRSFPELKDLATKRFVEEKRLQLETSQAKITSDLLHLENLAKQHMNGNYVSIG